ncbi:MAG: rod shape-determining protein [Actinomycetota bacterium]|nr:rod shape-determining protein [Actinomycetota bacterium]
MGHWGFLSGGRDLAIDLGTANTLVFVAGEGIVVDEPSVVAVDEDGEVYAVGSQAERMLGRTPASISAQRPLKDGVIADFEITEQMLRHFIRRALGSRRRARLIVCAPSGITSVEARAVVDASLAAGARNVELIEEPLAAALGAGLDISEPTGQMVVDIGGGTSEVALLSMGGIVVSNSMRLGGYTLDEAIVAYVKGVHRLAIGSRTAEALKLSIGSAYPPELETSAEIRGRDLVSGMPRELTLTSGELRSALDPTVSAIVEGIQETLDRTPPNLASDVAGHGILLAGGGALLGGFGERVRAETGMPVHLAASPLTCVVSGAGAALVRDAGKKRVTRPGVHHTAGSGPAKALR